MSSPASKSGSAATSPAGAGQGGGSGPTVTPTASAAAAPAKDKEESSFSRWKKKFSKPKRSEISATPAAISLLNVAAVHRAAHQRAALRAMRRWKAAVDALRDAQQARAINAAVRASGGGGGGSQGSAIFVPPPAGSSSSAAGMSGIGLGLAFYGSPLQRPRMPSSAGSSLSPPPLTGTGYASNLDPPSSPLPQPPSPLSPFLGARSPISAAGGIKASPRNRAVTFGGLEEEEDAASQHTAPGAAPGGGGGHARGNSIAIPHAQQGVASSEGQGLDAPSALAFSSSPLSAAMVLSPPSSSLPSSTGSLIPAAKAHRPSLHKVQSMTMAAPKRTLSPSQGEADAELATARARAAVLANSPWTSARPVRPSIIRADSRRSIMQPAAGARGVLGLGGAAGPGSKDAAGAIHHDASASLSPAMAFKRSLRARDSVILTARAAASAGSTPSSTPLSPSRDINAADGAPPPIPPHGMDAHPRGAVMLGDTKEWTEKDAQAAAAAAASAGNASVPPTSPKNKGVRFDGGAAATDTGAASAVATAGVSDPALSARRDMIRLRWKGAIKQIMSLSLWARRRSGSRLSVSVIGSTAAAAAAAPTAGALMVHSGSESDRSATSSDDDDDDRTTIDPALLAMGAKPVTPKSTAAASTGATTAAAVPPASSSADADTAAAAASVPDGPSLTPKNTLLDYFLLFGLGDSALGSLEAELRRLAATGTGLTSRKHLESLIADANHQLSAANHGTGAQPDLLLRFPARNRRHFPLDPAWGVFAFPENVAVSLTPRVTQLYSSVMTLADGMALFATYLKFDQPLLPELPHAFCPEPNGGAHHSSSGGGSGGSNGSATASPVPQGRFAFPPSDSPSPPAVSVTPGSTHSASSPQQLNSHTLPLYYPQVYVPRCMVLVSHYPQLDVLRQIASQLFEVACSPGAVSSSTGVSLEAYLVALCFEIPLPVPRKYAIRFRIHRALCTTIFPGVRSTVHSALNLELLFRTLNVDNSLGVLAAMLTESRILFHSTSLNLLSHVMLGFLQIFFPFQWWYSFVPLLTEAMLDAHEIPQPYMLGVHSKHLPLLHALDEVLIVDLDHDVLRCSVVLTPLPIKDGRELWINWRRSYERIAIQKIDQSADCRVEQMERWSREHNAFPNASSTGLPPLHGPSASAASSYPSPAQHPSPALSPAQLTSQVTMSSASMQGHARRSSFITTGSGGAGGASVPATPGGLLASPVAPPHPGLGPPSSTAASPAGAGAWSGPSSHMPPPSGATPIASPFPATAFNLDEEVYAALLRFYSDLLSGYVKFLFFISDVPFFNAQGFLSARVSKDPSSLAFFQRFVASRAFDVFIEEESSPDAYHEFLATGTPINRIQTILRQDLGTCEKVLCIPDPAPVNTQHLAAAASAEGAAVTAAAESAKPPSSSKPSLRRVVVEVESFETRDEVIQAVQMLDPQDHTTMMGSAARGTAAAAAAAAAVGAATSAAAALNPSLHFPVSGTPFAQPLRAHLIADATQAHDLVSAKGTPAPSAPSAVAPALRSFHWAGLEADLLHFNFSLLQPTPRKPKSLAPEEDECGAGGCGGSTAAAAAALAASATHIPATVPPASPMVRAPSAPSMHEAGGDRDLTVPAAKKKHVLVPYASASHIDTSSAAHQDHRVKHLLSQIFSSHTLSKDEMKEFRALMSQPHCRRLFASILAQPKHHHGAAGSAAGGNGSGGSGSGGGGGSSSGSTSLCLTAIGFEQLSSLVLALLDSSYSAHDYLSALGALDSATVYYWEQPAGGGGTGSSGGGGSGGGGSGRNHGPSRVYLESAMKSHRIWQEMDFWRAGLAHALSARAIKQGHSRDNATAAAAAPPSSPSATASSSAPPSASGSSSASANEFLLQWLISAAHQMLSNQVPFARVDSLIKEMSHTHQLSAEGLSTITAFLAKTKEAMQFWNA